MRITCLNGWGGTLHDHLLPWLAEAPPDILCLQEVVHSPDTDADWLTYRDGDHVLPQRANFFRDFCAALPDHQAVFCPAARGVLWQGETAIPSFWGLATFVHRARPIIGQVQGFVHKDYAHDGYGEHPRSRSAHGVRVHDGDLGRSVSVVHMHGLRDLAGKMDTPERATQAARLRDMSRQLSRPGDRRVVCGDFNVLPDSETLEILRADGVTELVTAGGHDGTRTSHYTKPGKFADYMLVDDPDAVRRFDVVRAPEVSDHCPLELEL
ncbi:endonuclease/exonuclease/phosphatase family protein [Palleronia pelagia]|uniref:Metal-dependent hydrolase, endonuclease/exonuclease/phosphatase family n=1 Tax=Palleronia pelagia TaxID=387096 RepID=A0A1H8JKS9_9RHOB|nr:endonuclease/exonuclease/phosphatase family protein [Palleronia pelagia]SEN81302.1 Metal-dependent hydrolase, endonuclease/exonuclease/phosphatase family [Palleronia pelagia]